MRAERKGQLPSGSDRNRSKGTTMATAPHTTNVLRLPSAAPAKVKQPSWAVRTRLARNLPTIRPVVPVQPSPLRDTHKSTPLLMVMAIYAALPPELRRTAFATARLLDSQAPSDYSADALEIMRQADELRGLLDDAARTFATETAK